MAQFSPAKQCGTSGKILCKIFDHFMHETTIFQKLSESIKRDGVVTFSSTIMLTMVTCSEIHNKSHSIHKPKSMFSQCTGLLGRLA